MAQANRRHTTKPVSKSTDPVVIRARTLRELWDAHDGAESEAFAAKQNGDTSLNTVINEQTDQILQWKDIVENEISFLLATSLQGTIVQLAILQDTLNDLEERVAKLEDDDAGRILFKMRRLTRSVIEVVYETLGKRGGACF